MTKNKKHKITREEKLEHYFNVWGSSKKSLVGITRQLTFLLGCISCVIVAIWVLLNAMIPYFGSHIFKTVTNHLAIISLVFIVFVLALDLIYVVTEWIALNKFKNNRLPNLIVDSSVVLILLIFIILTCAEIYGKHKAQRDFLYCIYMVICFSCCVYSTVSSFNSIQRGLKFNPLNKLLKSISYTVPFLGLLAVIIYILWVMWYSSSDQNLSYTCFLLARTSITLVGSIIIALCAQIVLCVAIKNPSKYKLKRLIYLSVFAALLFGLEMWCGSLFLKDGPWLFATNECKVSMTLLSVSVLAISGIDISLAGRYASHLEKK